MGRFRRRCQVAQAGRAGEEDGGEIGPEGMAC